MGRLIVRWLLAACALLAVTYLYSGVEVRSFGSALLAAAVIGLFNATLRPVLVILTLVICYDVAGRLLLNKPFAGTAELAGVGLVLLTFMQAPYVIRERKLLRVTFFLDRLPPAVRSQLNAFTYLLGAAFFIAMVIASWEPSLAGWHSGEFFGNGAASSSASASGYCFSSSASRPIWYSNSSRCERTDTYSPAAMEKAPASRPATPAKPSATSAVRSMSMRRGNCPASANCTMRCRTPIA